MRISTKGRYGLRAMVDLAVHSAGNHVPLNAIAERQDLSEGYLEQVFSTLRKAGLVNSVKGAQGGYTLADSADDITVGDILRALEGDLHVVDYQEYNEKAENITEHCLNIQVWERINKSINLVVDSITLEDLVNEYNKLAGNVALMYYI